MLRLPAIATALVLLALAAYALAGQIGAGSKLAALDAPAQARGDYAITLAFAPERFHRVLLQGKGRLVAVRGHTVYMKDVEPAALRSIASNYWVQSVARWSGS